MNGWRSDGRCAYICMFALILKKQEKQFNSRMNSHCLKACKFSEHSCWEFSNSIICKISEDPKKDKDP